MGIGSRRSGKTSFIQRSMSENRQSYVSIFKRNILTTVTTLTTVFLHVAGKMWIWCHSGKILSLPSLLSSIIKKEKKEEEK